MLLISINLIVAHVSYIHRDFFFAFYRLQRYNWMWISALLSGELISLMVLIDKMEVFLNSTNLAVIFSGEKSPKPITTGYFLS